MGDKGQLQLIKWEIENLKKKKSRFGKKPQYMRK